MWTFESENSGRIFPAPGASRRGPALPRHHKTRQKGPYGPLARPRTGPAQRRGRPHLVRSLRVLHLPVATRARISRESECGRGRNVLLPLPRQHPTARPDGNVRAAHH
jgi:hypothetical protein